MDVLYSVVSSVLYVAVEIEGENRAVQDKDHAFRTRIGSPTLFIIAEVVLQQLETHIMTQHQPKFSACYVDDNFAIKERIEGKAVFLNINKAFLEIKF